MITPQLGNKFTSVHYHREWNAFFSFRACVLLLWRAKSFTLLPSFFVCVAFQTIFEFSFLCAFPGKCTARSFFSLLCLPSIILICCFISWSENAQISLCVRMRSLQFLLLSFTSMLRSTFATSAGEFPAYMQRCSIKQPLPPQVIPLKPWNFPAHIYRFSFQPFGGVLKF